MLGSRWSPKLGLPTAHHRQARLLMSTAGRKPWVTQRSIAASFDTPVLPDREAQGTGRMLYT